MVYFSGSSFFREIYETRFFAALKDINLQKLKTLPLQTLRFSCLKFVSRRMWYAVKSLEKEKERERKSQIKLWKNKKHICLGIYISSLKPIILTEMIVKHYLIVAYYT